jgi:hypothetical protein
MNVPQIITVFLIFRFNVFGTCRNEWNISLQYDFPNVKKRQRDDLKGLIGRQSYFMTECTLCIRCYHWNLTYRPVVKTMKLRIENEISSDFVNPIFIQISDRLVSAPLPESIIIVFQGLGLLVCSGLRIYFLKLMNLFRTVGRTPWMGDRPDARPLPTHTHTHRGKNNREKCGHTSMPRVGFEPTIPVFERPKTVRASDCSAIGTSLCESSEVYSPLLCLRSMSLLLHTAIWIVTANLSSGKRGQLVHNSVCHTHHLVQCRGHPKQNIGLSVCLSVPLHDHTHSENGFNFTFFTRRLDGYLFYDATSTA